MPSRLREPVHPVLGSVFIWMLCGMVLVLGYSCVDSLLNRPRVAGGPETPEGNLYAVAIFAAKHELDHDGVRPESFRALLESLNEVGVEDAEGGVGLTEEHFRSPAGQVSDGGLDYWLNPSASWEDTTAVHAYDRATYEHGDLVWVVVGEIEVEALTHEEFHALIARFPELDFDLPVRAGR